MAAFGGTLKDLRRKVIDISGRYDLVGPITDPDDDSEVYTDNGIDFHINSAQRYLDRKVLSGINRAVIETTITAGETHLNIGNIRSLERVRIVDSNEESYYPERWDKRDVVNHYGSEPYGTGVVNSAPVIYYLDPIRGSDPSSEELTTRSVRLYPPADVDYTAYLEGVVFSETLVDDDDISYWTLSEPDVLIMATQYKLEQYYRNTQGAQDFYIALQEMIDLIDKDLIESELGTTLQIKNSW